MFYREFSVAEPLQPFIHCIWVMRAASGLFRQPERLVPDGNIEVILNYGDAFCQSFTEIHDDAILYKGSHVIGQRNTYYFTATEGKTDFISISFKPGGLSPFVNFPVADFTAAIVPLQIFRSYVFTQMEEEVFEIKELEEKIRRIEQLLLKGLYENAERLNRLMDFMPLLRSVNNYPSVSHFLERYTVHKRKLQRDFDHHVGVSPKFLQRVLRFKKALTLFYAAKVRSLTELAYECGYYDQAHFINEFKSFAGITPREYFYACKSSFAELLTEA